MVSDAFGILPPSPSSMCLAEGGVAGVVARVGVDEAEGRGLFAGEAEGEGGESTCDKRLCAAASRDLRSRSACFKPSNCFTNCSFFSRSSLVPLNEPSSKSNNKGVQCQHYKQTKKRAKNQLK